MAVDELKVKITGDASNLKKALSRSEIGIAKFANKVAGIGKTMAVAGIAVTAISIGLIKMASDAEEVGTKFAVVFQDVSVEAEKTAANLTKNFGLSSTAAKQLLSDTGDLLTGFGFTGEAALDLATQVNELAVDLASFTNYSGGAEGASAALTKALLGERESVKALGISILEVDVKTKMLEMSQRGMTFETERQAKAYATLLIAQEQSKNAIGDFARTSAGFANQMRIAKARVSDLGVTLGTKLLPIATQLINKVVEITEKVNKWTEENKELTEKIVKWGAALGVALAVMGPILMLLPALIAGVTALSGAFLPFAIGGAIVVGLIKIQDLLGDIKKTAFETALGFKDWGLDKLGVAITEVEGIIVKLTAELDAADKGFKVFGITIKNQDVNIGRLKQTINDYGVELGLLKEQKKKLTEAEKEGIEISKEVLEVDGKVLELLEEKIETNKTINALQRIQNSVYKLTHTELEIAINDLDLLKLEYIDLGIEIEKVNKWYDLEIKALNDLNKTVFKCGQQFMKFGKDIEVAGYKLPTNKVFLCGQAFLKLGEDVIVMGDTLPKLGDKFKALEDIAKPVITRITGYLETQLAGAISNLLNQTEDFKWSWSSFWTGLKNVLINAVAAMIAKLIVLAAFSWLFPFLSIGFNKGGRVGYDKGGAVKKYQAGGGVDTVPARLTVGEYVIAKPMTDFIRRFNAIPGNLIAAIAGGMPTPVPAFAGGGLVGTSSVSAVGFGGTTIYVDIHDNKIDKDIDIKRLAATVSDEILRKLNGKRRH